MNNRSDEWVFYFPVPSRDGSFHPQVPAEEERKSSKTETVRPFAAISDGKLHLSFATVGIKPE